MAGLRHTPFPPYGGVCPPPPHTGKVYFEVYLKSVGAKHLNESSLALGACLS
jgi:phosphatidylethanolamine-binding protein (PEBP) family uncharacterized protein